MKTILVPTDFSAPSYNAACYGGALAKQLNAKLMLLHIFHIPVVPNETPVLIETYEELERDNLEQMKSFEAKLRLELNYDKEIEYLVKPGFVSDEVAEVVSEKNIDLIVMGIKGSGKLNEILIGSNTTSVIKNLECPTLVVPENVKFKSIKNIAYACDFEHAKNSKASEQIKSLIKIFNSKLMIVNVVDPDKKPSYEKAVSGVQLENTFENINHSLHFPEDNDIVFAINEFIDKHQIDLLIMVPKKHSLLGGLFHKSNTKKMAFHTHIPLLAIHE